MEHQPARTWISTFLRDQPQYPGAQLNRVGIYWDADSYIGVCVWIGDYCAVPRKVV